jgi:hypothetical protein
LPAGGSAVGGIRKLPGLEWEKVVETSLMTAAHVFQEIWWSVTQEQPAMVCRQTAAAQHNGLQSRLIEGGESCQIQNYVPAIRSGQEMKQVI